MILAGGNGLLTLSIPVTGGRNQKGLYREVRIDHSGDWQKRHWRSVLSAYGKSPWFFQYADTLEALFQVREDFLVDWNLRCLDWVLAALRRDPPVPVQAAGSVEGDLVDLKDRVLPADFQDPDLGPFPRYAQVFEDRLGFQPNLSILDLLLCCGPASIDYLHAID